MVLPIEATIDSLVLPRVVDIGWFLPMEAAVDLLDFAQVGIYRRFCPWRQLSIRWILSGLVVFAGFVHEGNHRFVEFCPCGSFAILLIWYQLWGLFFKTMHESSFRT